MKTDGGETLVSDQSSKQRKPKSREVSSRFLSSSITPSIESPNHTLYPLRAKPRSSTDSQKHRSLESSGFVLGLWPSSGSSSSSSSSSSLSKKQSTLADHLGIERIKGHEKSEKSMFFNRQRSCTEFSRFENEKSIAKENHKPFFGGSMRYTGKFRFPGKSSNSSSALSKSSSLVDDHDHTVPGRFSVDSNALRMNSLPRISDILTETQDSESECSDICSGSSFESPVIGKRFPASYMAPTVSSRKAGKVVSSKYMNDLPSRSRRWTVDSSTQHPVSSDNSPKKSAIKNSMKRTNSLTTYGSTTSQWALSPARSSSPPVSTESKGTSMSFSSLKPPTSPYNAKGVGNLLSRGLELFKVKKASSSTSSSPLGPAMTESFHQIRLLQNRLVQWRFANARAEAVNLSLANQAESNLSYAWNGLAKLQHSVLQKKLQLEKEKLQMKLNIVLHSQIKPLEAWGDMEWQHLSAVSMTKDCLHSVVCRVPLIEGAKVLLLSY
ncbi:unnamed protein product [Ilex paraguariensis]|uniref:QWRF motif-containing protein 3 n=1 Tax=Ilex paraguariensis TaxID=185542 RepID=A0ABC8TYE8_9AQUA